MKKLLLFLMPLFVIIGISFAHYNREIDMHKWLLDILNGMTNPFDAFDKLVELFGSTRSSILNVGSSTGFIDFMQNIWFVVRDFGLLLFGFFVSIFNFFYYLYRNIVQIFKLLF